MADAEEAAEDEHKWQQIDRPVPIRANIANSELADDNQQADHQCRRRAIECAFETDIQEININGEIEQPLVKYGVAAGREGLGAEHAQTCVECKYPEQDRSNDVETLPADHSVENMPAVELPDWNEVQRSEKQC